VTARKISLHSVLGFRFLLSSTHSQRLSAERLASSIHAIHRPLARSRKLSVPGSNPGSSTLYTPVEEEGSDTLLSEDEAEAEDFEETPRPPSPRPAHIHHAHSEMPTQSNERHITSSLSRIIPSRVGSMTTVRFQRRAGLAEKLREVFELDGIEEVRAGALSCTYTIEYFSSTRYRNAMLAAAICP